MRIVLLLWPTDLPRGLPEALGGEGIASCRLSYSLLRGDATVTRTAPVRRQEPGFRASLDENAPKPVGMALHSRMRPNLRVIFPCGQRRIVVFGQRRWDARLWTPSSVAP